MNLKQLREKRAQLLREAEAFKGADGSFKDDQARTAFDGKMTEVDAVDAQIRTAEEAERASANNPTEAAIRTAAVTEERARVTGIQDAVRVAGLDAPVAADLVQRGVSLDQARSEIFVKLAERSNANPTLPHVAVGQDAKDKWLRGATNWLLARSGMAALVAAHDKVDVSTIAPGEFRGLSLLDLARETLERAGRSVRGLDKQRLIGDALTLRDGGMIAQGTSDFATLLENAMYKVLQAAYATQPDTWRRFCAQSTVADFRTNPRYRMGNFSVLDSLNEQGEFKNKAISDAEKATIAVVTKGNIITISRQAIVNDDMNFFSQVPARMGRAAALSVEVDVYALLALNAGLGPTMPYDSTTLFHANHGNLTTGAALTAAAIDLDRVAMASQKEPNGNDYIDLRPTILLLSVGLGGQARVINGSQYDPDNVASGSKATMKPNIVVGLFRDVVDTPRISGTRRYLFADPAVAPVIEVAFLEGQSSPVLESRDGWRVDGAEMKVRFDYGVAGVDHRGAVTNAGA